MKSRSLLAAASLSFLAPAAWADDPAGIEAHRRRCEFFYGPLGVDMPRRRRSWELLGPARGERQSAWQVLAASSAEALAQDRDDLWDSGRVPSDETARVSYDGNPLTSSEQVF